MISNPAVYTLPDLQTLPLGEFDVAPEFTPDTLVIDQKTRGSTRYARPYRVCYLDRRNLDATVSSTKELQKVNLLSLCSQRTTLMAKVCKALLEGHSNMPSFIHIEKALNWIDTKGRSHDLSEQEAARQLYIDYTEHLRYRLRLSNVGQMKTEAEGSICYPTASIYQRALRYLCALALSTDNAVVEGWAIKIPQKKQSDKEVPAPASTSDDHNLAHAMHARIFDGLADAIVNQTAPPVVIELQDLGFDDLIYYSQAANNHNGWTNNGRTDWMPYFYRREGVFEGTSKDFNALLVQHSIEPIGTKNFKRKQDENRQFSEGQLIRIANEATRHFGYLLLAEAGNNAAHLASVDCSQIRLNKALGLAQMRAIKGRAGYENQSQYVDVRFAQTTWKKYLRLRQWMSAKLAHPPKRGVFLIPNRKNLEPYRFLKHSEMSALALWPEGAPTKATRASRKHRTVNLKKASGNNVALVSALQSATPQTIESHYAYESYLEAAKAMSEYFKLQAESAQHRYNGVAPVRVIDGGKTISSGICDENELSGPKAIDGVVDPSLQPRCGAPVTCIFCIHFGLHADDTDLIQLLTMKRWIEVQSRQFSSSIDEYFVKFAPYQNRIDQILADVHDYSDGFSQRLKDAKARFERGEQDHYWGSKINALLDIQEV